MNKTLTPTLSPEYRGEGEMPDRQMSDDGPPSEAAARRRRRGVRLFIALLAVGLVITDETVRRRAARRDAATTFRPSAAAMTRPHDAGTYLVRGQVDRPGAYEIPGRQVYLREAVGAAGVPGTIGRRSLVTISRRTPEGQEVVKVELYPLVREGRGDEALRADDQLYVQDAQ